MLQEEKLLQQKGGGGRRPVTATRHAKNIQAVMHKNKSREETLLVTLLVTPTLSAPLCWTLPVHARVRWSVLRSLDADAGAREIRELRPAGPPRLGAVDARVAVRAGNRQDVAALAAHLQGKRAKSVPSKQAVSCFCHGQRLSVVHVYGTA